MSHNICLIKSHDYISCETLSTVTCANPAHPTFDNIMFRLLLRNVFRISSSASYTNRRFSVSDLYLYSFPSKHLSIFLIIQAQVFICQYGILYRKRSRNLRSDSCALYLMYFMLLHFRLLLLSFLLLSFELQPFLLCSVCRTSWQRH